MAYIHKYFYAIEFVFLCIYKYLFDFVFIKRYLDIYGYMYNRAYYMFNSDKFIISLVLFGMFALLLLKYTKQEKNTYIVLIRFAYLICIIPMLSVYAFYSNCEEKDFLAPSLFWFIFVIVFKLGFKKKEDTYKSIMNLPSVKNIDWFVLLMCGIMAIAIWFIAGKPLVFTLNEALEQRMQLRMNALPTLINYVFFFLGSAVFPYLFAKYMDRQDYIKGILSLAFGILLFMVNGMKTWLFLYLLYFLVKGINKLIKSETYSFVLMLEFGAILLIILSEILYKKFNSTDILAQAGRVIIVPNNIGFINVRFFRENEILYLRESILRLFAKSPYVNGSDFYINFGASSTVTSARANNGLWGDAFKNFGYPGILFYPLMYLVTFKIVDNNGRDLSNDLRIFVLYLIFWTAVNVSFFTWLLTGGVIVIIILEKIDTANLKYLNNKRESSRKPKYHFMR